MTGWIGGDPYGRETDALKQLGICDKGRPIAMREWTHWSPAHVLQSATYNSNRSEFLRAAVSPPLVEPLEGNIWHEPLPLEFAREEEPLRALLGEALAAAKVPVHGSGLPLTVRVLNTKKSALLIGVNEGSAEATRAVDVDGHQLGLRVAPGLSQLLAHRPRYGRDARGCEEAARGERHLSHGDPTHTSGRLAPPARAGEQGTSPRRITMLGSKAGP